MPVAILGHELIVRNGNRQLKIAEHSEAREPHDTSWLALFYVF